MASISRQTSSEVVSAVPLVTTPAFLDVVFKLFRLHHLFNELSAQFIRLIWMWFKQVQEFFHVIPFVETGSPWLG